MRLNKYLAHAGIGSRRKVEELIFEGRVKINQKVVDEPGRQVERRDRVTIDGEGIHLEKKVYYVLHKPCGYVCTSDPHEPRKRVIDLFPKNHRLFTVGRLDKDTSGLLLVTNDGDFAQDVIHPSANQVKVYVAKTGCEITPDHLKKLSTGARVEKKWVKPVKVSKVRRGTVKIHVKEGRKHEVRVLLERAGLTTLELKRIQIGALTLGTLPEGHFRTLSAAERNIISK